MNLPVLRSEVIKASRVPELKKARCNAGFEEGCLINERQIPVKRNEGGNGFPQADLPLIEAQTCQGEVRPGAAHLETYSFVSGRGTDGFSLATVPV